MKVLGFVAAAALASSISVASAATTKTIDYNFDITITKASKITGADTYCQVSVIVQSAPGYSESATAKAKGSKCLVKLPVRWVEKDLPEKLNFFVEVYARETAEPYIELRSHGSSILDVSVPAGNNKTVKSTYKLRF